VSALSDDERYGAALAALGSSPVTLRRFLDGYRPRQAWEAIAAGHHRADGHGRYRAKADPATLEAVSAACVRGAVTVHLHGHCGYPAALADDDEAPPVLFALGDASRLDGRPRVAVVGTRSATSYGRGMATELGRDLALAGVVVVSGAARGIDAAAHTGALDVHGAAGSAPTVGVLGAGFGAPVTRVQDMLHDAVARHGVLLSQVPPGIHSARWWFAVRNRVVAALAHVVVVVECHARGGSLYTVDAALGRGRTVGAVPGSVRSPASRGTNTLIVDGMVPIRDVEDVLVALELAIAADSTVTPPRGVQRRGATGRARRPALDTASRRVHGALDHDPAPLDTVVVRSGLALGAVSLALEQLVEAGMATGEGGWWSRR
jgi:DNA processing protein